MKTSVSSLWRIFCVWQHAHSTRTHLLKCRACHCPEHSARPRLCSPRHRLHRRRGLNPIFSEVECVGADSVNPFACCGEVQEAKAAWRAAPGTCGPGVAGRRRGASERAQQHCGQQPEGLVALGSVVAGGAGAPPLRQRQGGEWLSWSIAVRGPCSFGTHFFFFGVRHLFS